MRTIDIIIIFQFFSCYSGLSLFVNWPKLSFLKCSLVLPVFPSLEYVNWLELSKKMCFLFIFGIWSLYLKTPLYSILTLIFFKDKILINLIFLKKILKVFDFLLMSKCIFLGLILKICFKYWLLAHLINYGQI